MGFLVYRAALVMKRQLAREFRPLDITPEQWAVLVRLWREDGLTQKELADRTYKDPPTMTRICRKLEQKGLVTRTACEADGRVSRVRLSGPARGLIPELVPRAVRSVDIALTGVDAEETAAAKRVLRQIYLNLA